jgi:hypothetical protein
VPTTSANMSHLSEPIVARGRNVRRRVTIGPKDGVASLTGSLHHPLPLPKCLPWMWQRHSGAASSAVALNPIAPRWAHSNCASCQPVVTASVSAESFQCVALKPLRDTLPAAEMHLLKFVFVAAAWAPRG